MATKTGDVNTPPPGGYQNEGWYWDPAVKQARQYYNGKFGPPGDAGANWWKNGSTTSTPSTQPAQQVNPLQAVNESIQDSFKKLQDEVVQRFGEYRSGKPFNIDEVLAEKTKQAKEQIDPYYDQQLSDYLLGVQRKLDRGAADTKDLLAELSTSADSYQANGQIALDNAVKKAEEGFADAGLFGSGEQLSTESKIIQSASSPVEDYMRKNDAQIKQVTQANQRNVEDINADKTQFTSNLERNRFTDVGTKANQLTKEAGQQYTQGFQATLPTQLQSASGFDMLKSLGIYS